MGQRIMKRLADYSQYFLRRPQLIKELVGHSSIKKTDVVYDIGAGSGVISAVLASSFLLLSAPSHAQIFKDDCSELLGGNCATDEPAKKPPAPKKRVVTEIEALEVEPEKPRAVDLKFVIWKQHNKQEYILILC